MSHASGRVYAADGSRLLGYFEYNGTSDVVTTAIGSWEEMDQNWRTARNMRHCQCRPQQHTPVILHTDYGNGYYWSGSACLACRAITGGYDPYHTDDGPINGHPFPELVPMEERFCPMESAQVDTAEWDVLWYLAGLGQSGSTRDEFPRPTALRWEDAAVQLYVDWLHEHGRSWEAELWQLLSCHRQDARARFISVNGAKLDYVSSAPLTPPCWTLYTGFGRTALWSVWRVDTADRMRRNRLDRVILSWGFHNPCINSVCFWWSQHQEGASTTVLNLLAPEPREGGSGHDD